MRDDINIWVERYRPMVLDDMVLNQETKDFFKKCIEEQEIPHLLLYGKAGTGKTTVARILIKELGAEYIELNASDERGIDTIREKVKQFVMIDSIKKWKIVFFDEADQLTQQAQFTLRNMMEKFSNKSRFIFSINYLEKIIEPIQSRFQLVKFTEVDEQSQFTLLKKVLDNEKVKYSFDDLLKVIDDCEGDLRRVLNTVQRLVKKDNVVYISLKDKVDPMQLWSLAKEKKWVDIRKVLDDGTDTQYVLKKLFDFVFENVSADVAVEIIGEYLYRDSIVYDRELNTFLCLYELVKRVR